jgi:SAM-dependent methyltransferase
MIQSPSFCPLCSSGSTVFFYRDRRRDYWRCNGCQLIFVPREFHLSEAQEKAQYDLHQNRPEDPGYRQFLARLADPLLARLNKPVRGLDFGCGPGPTLHLMLKDAGHSVEIYDKFYALDPVLLTRQYDFITATEVVEHLAKPGEVLDLLWNLLKPGGLLALMTKQVTDAEAFARWHYKNDPTHIAFFSQTTFIWLARQWGASCNFLGKEVVFIEK